MSAAKRRLPKRRPWFQALFLLGVALAALGCWWFFRPGPPPEPPMVDLSGADPAVRRVVENARAAVLQNPDAADAWGKLGMLILCHGLSGEAAETCLAQAERLDPRQARWPDLEAAAVLLTNPDLALAKLQRAVELCDCTPDAPRLQLAEMLLDRGRLEEARSHFDRILQKQPDNARALLGLARLAFDRGDWTETANTLQRCTADLRTSKAAHSLLAQTYEQLGKQAAAEQELRLAAELPKPPPWPDPFQEEANQLRVGKQIWLARADRFLHQDRFAEALQILERTVRDYPNEPWAWLMLGRAHLGRKDLPAAEKAERKATELDPKLAEAYFYLGVALILQKNASAATPCFRKATELKPDYALAYYNLGHSLKEQGDDTAAIAAFRQALGCRPGLAAAHFNLGDLLAKKGQRDEAIAHLQHALELNPKDESAKKRLAQVQAAAGSAARP